MKIYANLHLHSTHSDGKYTPEELVRLAKEEGYGAIAVTDHDTVTANEALMRCAKENGLESIFGCEFTVPASMGENSDFHFVAFDFDNHNQVKTYRYELDTIWKNGYNFDKICDKNHSLGWGCSAIFHMDAINAQIMCHYSTNSDYNFYQGDEISIQFVDAYQKFEPDGVKEEWADQRTFNIETLDCDIYYEYMYVYQININGNEEVILKIAVENEMSIEELDAIAQLFVDNIVIINTEG